MIEIVREVFDMLDRITSRELHAMDKDTALTVNKARERLRLALDTQVKPVPRCKCLTPIVAGEPTCWYCGHGNYPKPLPRYTP